jgi:hypothetical protein
MIFNALMSGIKDQAKAAADGDSDYDSAEDDDFRDSDTISNSSCEKSDAPKRGKAIVKDLDSGDEVTIAKRKKKGGEPEADDLILTRAQKRARYISIIH